jgi:hypothetical protein
MARQPITIGAQDAGNGDTLFAAFTKVEANFVELYNDDAGDVGSVDGGTGLEVDTTTGDVTVSISDNGVGHDQLAARYTEVQDISSTTSPINLDASSYSGFNLTGALGTVDLNIQNIKKGQVIDIILSGSLSSAAITLTDNFTSSTINKVGTSSLDTSTTNILQVLCTDDDDAGAILHWAVASYASGATV